MVPSQHEYCDTSLWTGLLSSSIQHLTEGQLQDATGNAALTSGRVKSGISQMLSC